jgi:predicted N-acetyltransferase YhbS
VTTADGVRRLAFYPFLEARTPPGWLLVDRAAVTVRVHDLPLPLIVHPTSALDDVPAAVAAARDIAREHGRTDLVWLLAPEDVRLRPGLERCGLVNRDAPGFEAVENVMALEHSPAGPHVDDVQVDPIRSVEDVDAGHRVMASAFGLPDDAYDGRRDSVWQQSQDPASPLTHLVARIDGRVVGTALAADADHGLTLFGGAVLVDARGRGVYRALVAKRWDLAVERGTPALTVQAGRMSEPVLSRLGFRKLGELLVFDDPG